MRNVLLAAAITFTFCSAEAATYRVALSGQHPTSAPGGSAGAGAAFVTVDASTVSYYVWAKVTTTPTAARIHSGRATETGAIVLDLAPSFASPVAGIFVATGSVPADAALTSAILGNPGAYYVELPDDADPTSALRGQLLGSGPVASAFASSLNGARGVPVAGDPKGSGFAAAIVDGADLYYYIRVLNVATPTAAHIHRGSAGEAGPVVVGFAAPFSSGVAFGSEPVPAGALPELLTNPEHFYFNVHNDEFPAGALRGQLAPTETIRLFPVVAHNKGAGTSVFKSDVRILNLTDEDATVVAEWYPKNTNGLAGPAVTAPVVIPANNEAVVDDAVATLFAANDRGAIRLVSTSPFHAVENTFNDQRPSGAGTFGQFAEAVGIEGALSSGVLLLNSNRPKTDGLDFRTNMGYFNPNPFPVTLSLSVRKPDNTLVGTASQRTVPPFANDVVLYYQFATGVPVNQRTQPNFFVTYAASDPIFVFSSVVDNKTDDGLQQPALAFAAASSLPANSPPHAEITVPAADLSVRAGEAVSFAGTATDPDGDDITVAWDFGDGTSSALLSTSHSYSSAGTFNVTLTATDARGLVGAPPATRVVTVTANHPPHATITAPAASVTIHTGEAVTFAGTASDPDGDPVTVVWNFGDGSTSTALAAGNHTYSSVGTFTVTLTATDSFGLADPSPDTRTITVGPDTPPNGTIVTPATDITAQVGQSVSFVGTASDPDGDAVTVTWTFGDGVSATDLSTTHTYVTAGTFTVTFTATDAYGLVDPTPATRTITVNPVSTATLTKVQAQIFTPFCSGCHPPNQEMDLRAGNAFGSTVGVPSNEQPNVLRIAPGDPANSYLYRKLAGTPGITGSRMPQGGPFLSPAALQLVHDWIAAGALNN